MDYDFEKGATDLTNKLAKGIAHGDGAFAKELMAFALKLKMNFELAVPHPLCSQQTLANLLHRLNSLKHTKITELASHIRKVFEKTVTKIEEQRKLTLASPIGADDPWSLIDIDLLWLSNASTLQPAINIVDEGSEDEGDEDLGEGKGKGKRRRVDQKSQFDLLKHVKMEPKCENCNKRNSKECILRIDYKDNMMSTDVAKLKALLPNNIHLKCKQCNTARQPCSFATFTNGVLGRRNNVKRPAPSPLNDLRPTTSANPDFDHSFA